jgi:hypothetical protein
MLTIGCVGEIGYRLYKDVKSWWGGTEVKNENPQLVPSTPIESSAPSVPLPTPQQIQTEDEKESDGVSPFHCPITLQIMTDPVITPQGICFERQVL